MNATDKLKLRLMVGALVLLFRRVWMNQNDLENKVDKDLCKIIHKQVDKQIEGLQTCVAEIRGAIGEMKEIAASNNEILKILMEERSIRINQPSMIQSSGRKRFWEMTWFKYIVIAGCIVSVSVIGTAIGYNILDHYINAMGGSK